MYGHHPNVPSKIVAQYWTVILKIEDMGKKNKKIQYFLRFSYIKHVFFKNGGVRRVLVSYTVYIMMQNIFIHHKNASKQREQTV